jgi:hypothetical protein
MAGSKNPEPPPSLVGPAPMSDDEVRAKLRSKEHPDRPIILLSHESTFCSMHGEPFRAEWPKGSIVFQIEAMHILLMRVDLVQEVEALGGTFEHGVEAVLKKIPACCRLTDDELLALYEKSGVGRIRRCFGCNATAKGTPYRIVDPDVDAAKHVELEHLCFGCVVTNLRNVAS